MKNLKIGMKLAVGFGTVLVLLLIVSIVGITNMMQSSINLDYLGGSTLPATNYTWNIRRDLVSIERGLYKAIATTKLSDTEKFLAEVDKDADSLYKNLASLRTLYKGDMGELDKLKTALDRCIPIREKVIGYAKEGTTEDNLKAAAVLNEEYSVPFGEAVVIVSNIYPGIEKRANDTVEEAHKSLQISIILLCLVTVAALVIAIIFALYIARSIAKPIKEIEHAAAQIVSGDLNTVIEYTSKDELGSLAVNMRNLCKLFNDIIHDLGDGLTALGNGDFTSESKVKEHYVGDFKPLEESMYKIICQLSNTLSQINQSADQVSSGADQVASGAQALSQGATEQASSIEELAATINEISSQIITTSENASEANKQTNTVKGEATQSNQRMQNMLVAMSEISQSSGEIGKIIKTIEDIAFQTNILALNAAVEAARAGVAGKGFAVVADEVRNLASKSADASKSTSVLIESSLKAVENGKNIADETAKSLSTVMVGIQAVAATVSKITLAADEQAMSISQVSQGVDQISSVVQTNSATAEESAAASQELSGQSQMLKDLVSQFKLRHIEN